MADVRHFQASLEVFVVRGDLKLLPTKNFHLVFRAVELFSYSLSK